MYTRFYKVSCDPSHAANLMTAYEETIADTIRQSPAHIGYQMVETGPGQWLLVSNYVSKGAAAEYAPKAKDLVAPMVADFGMEISVLGEGETVHNVSQLPAGTPGPLPSKPTRLPRQG